MGELAAERLVPPSPCGVTFIEQPSQTIRRIELGVPAGLQGYDQRLTIAAHDYAVDHGYTHWVQPYAYQNAPLMDPITEWLVFAVSGLGGCRRDFLHRTPTREAAEMWVLHRGT